MSRVDPDFWLRQAQGLVAHCLAKEFGVTGQASRQEPIRPGGIVMRQTPYGESELIISGRRFRIVTLEMIDD